MHTPRTNKMRIGGLGGGGGVYFRPPTAVLVKNLLSFAACCAVMPGTAAWNSRAELVLLSAIGRNPTGRAKPRRVDSGSRHVREKSRWRRMERWGRGGGVRRMKDVTRESTAEKASIHPGGCTP